MYPETLFIPGLQEADNASTAKCAPPDEDSYDSTAPTDEVGPPPYPGLPTLACGFFRVVDDSIFIATGNPPRLRSVTGDPYGASPRYSPTSWSLRSSSSSNAALHFVRGLWVTLFIASMLFVAGVATTGLAYAKGVDVQFRRHGMLMILAAAAVVIVAAVFNVYRMIRYNSLLPE